MNLNPSPEEPETAWLAPAGAAAHLSLPVDLLNRLRRAGEGPPYTILGPRTRRYRIKDLDAWVSELPRKP